jgi:hypothetical protein
MSCCSRCIEIRCGGEQINDCRYGLWAFAGEVTVRDDVAVVVAEVLTIAVFRAVGATHVSIESTHLVRLVDVAKGSTDVFEFVVDVEGDFRQADDHGQDSNGGDQDKFSRNNETGFVIQEGVKEVGHDRDLSVVQSVENCVIQRRVVFRQMDKM